MAAVGKPIGGLGLVASVGALVAYRLRQRAERKRAEGELKRAEGELRGLLCLVYVEAAVHQSVIRNHFRDINPEIFHSANPVRSLTTDDWIQVRSRIAQLLPADEFARLAEYYLNVQTFNNLLDGHTPSKDGRRQLQIQADSIANDLGPKIREWMRNFCIGPGSTLPTAPSKPSSRTGLTSGSAPVL
jgi:hypothetical protein